MARRCPEGGRCSRSSSSVLFPLLLRRRLVVRWRRAGSRRGPAALCRGLRLPAGHGAMSGGAAGIPKPLPSSGPKSLREMPHPLATSSSEEMGPALTPSPDLLLPRSIADKVRPRGGQRRGGPERRGKGCASASPQPLPGCSPAPRGGAKPESRCHGWQAGAGAGLCPPGAGAVSVLRRAAALCSVAEPPTASSRRLCGRMLSRAYLSLPSLCFPACGVCREGL